MQVREAYMSITFEHAPSSKITLKVSLVTIEFQTRNGQQHQLSPICYAPLLYGATTVMYEGKPDRTPDPGQYYRIIEEHKVNTVFSVPTVFRVLRRVDPEVKYGKRHSLSSATCMGFTQNLNDMTNTILDEHYVL